MMTNIIPLLVVIILKKPLQINQKQIWLLNKLDDQEKQNIKIEETWLYEVYEEYPENKLMFYKVVELEIPEK